MTGILPIPTSSVIESSTPFVKPISPFGTGWRDEQFHSYNMLKRQLERRNSPTLSEEEFERDFNQFGLEYDPTKTRAEYDYILHLRRKEADLGAAMEDWSTSDYISYFAGLVASEVTEPLNYLSLGAVGLGKIGAKVAAKGLAGRTAVYAGAAALPEVLKAPLIYDEYEQSQTGLFGDEIADTALHIGTAGLFGAALAPLGPMAKKLMGKSLEEPAQKAPQNFVEGRRRAEATQEVSDLPQTTSQAMPDDFFEFADGTVTMNQKYVKTAYEAEFDLATGGRRTSYWEDDGLNVETNIKLYRDETINTRINRDVNHPDIKKHVDELASGDLYVEPLSRGREIIRFLSRIDNTEDFYSAARQYEDATRFVNLFTGRSPDLRSNKKAFLKARTAMRDSDYSIANMVRNEKYMDAYVRARNDIRFDESDNITLVGTTEKQMRELVDWTAKETAVGKQVMWNNRGKDIDISGKTKDEILEEVDRLEAQYAAHRSYQTELNRTQRKAIEEGGEIKLNDDQYHQVKDIITQEKTALKKLEMCLINV